MSSTPLTPFANTFPPELLLHIFALASAHPPTALALARTSAFAHTISAPILRRTARLRNAKQLAAFESSTTTHPDVQHLGVLCQAAPARVRHILSSCANAQSIACGFNSKATDTTSSTPANSEAHGNTARKTPECTWCIPFERIGQTEMTRLS